MLENTLQEKTAPHLSPDNGRVARQLSWLLPLAGLLFSLSAAAQDPVDPRQEAPQPVWRTTTQEGFTTWRLEVNSGCLFTDHRYTLPIPAEPERMSNITLSMTNYDVDYNDPQGCAGGPEVDIAFFNDHRLGILTGRNDSWSLNTWRLNQDQVVNGDNRIFIDTDAPGTGCWCVGVGYIEVRAMVDFQVVSHTPPANDRHRNFRANGLDLRVRFSDEYDPATLHRQSFKLEYQDMSTEMIRWAQVAGRFSAVTPQEFRFIPDQDLRDGVRYRVSVLPGPNGVKSRNGNELWRLERWHFWTVPDLNVTDAFDYGWGSYCPPSPSPCPGLELAVFQVARNMTMVPEKAAVARVYLRWRKHDDIPPLDQVREMDVEAKISAPNLSSLLFRQTVERPSRYHAPDRAAARNTINIFHPPPAFPNYSVRITPRPQTNSRVVEYTQTLHLDFLPTTLRPIQFNYYILRDGAWDGGVPAAHRTAGRNLMTSGCQLVTDQFPVLSTRHTVRGEVDVGYLLWPETMEDATCGTVNKAWCDPFPITADVPERICVYQRMRQMLGGRRFVAVTVPANLCPTAAGMAINQEVVFHFSSPPDRAETIAHEIGHVFGISKANQPSNGHRNNSAGVEGFQVRTRTNRSRIENPAATVSLMRERSGTWIHNEDYGDLLALVNRDKKQPENAEGYLIVMGTIDVDSGAVLLTPAFWQELPNDPSTGEGQCLFELLNDGGGVVSSTYVTPGIEELKVVRAGGDGPAAARSRPQSGFAAQMFSASLPWSSEARAVRISCGGAVLWEETFSPNPPLVAFDNLNHGDLLSGAVTLSWTATDPDGSDLYYQLQIRDDDGIWAPLTPLIRKTSIELDSTNLPSTSDGLLRIMVTDGFNTAYDSKEVKIQNHLQVMGVHPADGAGESVEALLNSSITALFNAAVDFATVDEVTFQVLESGAIPVAGSRSPDAEGYGVTFLPAHPLEPLTSYTVYLGRGIEDLEGNRLEETFSWSFTTEVDGVPPSVIATSPADSDLEVPRNALIQAEFSEAMDPATINGTSFQLLESARRRVAGTVSYDSGSRQALFIPDTPLLEDSEYLARVTTAAGDEAGNGLAFDHEWRFITGSSSHSGLRITGAFRDQAIDLDGDGLFDNLTIEVQVEVLHGGAYNLNGRLLDEDGSLIGWAGTGDVYLATGVHTLHLVYDGAPIRSNGVDGPYLLDALNFYDAGNPAFSDVRLAACWTFPYDAQSFFGVLVFGGLPDQVLPWNSFVDNAFNLRDFTWHANLPVTEISYRVFINTDPRVEVTIDSDANVDIYPEPDTETESDVTIEATDHLNRRALATFHIRVEAVRAPAALEIPTLSPAGLFLLVALVAIAALALVRRRSGAR